MKKIRFAIALFFGKAAMFLLKLLGKPASYTPGSIAVRICPDILERLKKPEVVVCVTGTNGKTTLSNMIVDVLQDNNVAVLNNSLGSNTVAGIVSAVMSSVTLKNKQRYHVAVLEVDERSSRLIYQHLKPTYVVCTNLFRDSMRRNAHTDYIADIIDKNLPESAIMILNGDDPISSRLGRDNGKVYFGINPLQDEKEERNCIIRDMRICPNCGEPVVYDFMRYHHIGRLHCSKCAYTSPQTQYTVLSADYENEKIRVGTHRGVYEFPLVNKNIYNIYNEVTAITLLTQLGLKQPKIAASLKKIKIASTRQSQTKVGDMDIVCHVAKGQNPVACSRAFSFMKNDTGKKVVYLTVDDVFDQKETSENISWIYETDFEYFNDSSILRIYIAGIRAQDYRLRLLLAGVPDEKIILLKGHNEIVKKLDLEGADKLFLLYDLYRYDEGMSIKNKICKRILKGKAVGVR